MAQELVGAALEDHLAAMLAGAGAKVDHVVGGPNRLLVVLDDDDRVAEIAQVRERRQQLAVVALVQADRRLVEDVQHPGQVGADLRGQPDALPLPARQRGGAAVQRQIADPDVVQEADAVANLPQHPARDQRFALGELEAVEHLDRRADRQVDVVGEAAPLDLHRQALRLQPLAAAGRTFAKRPEWLELLLDDPRAFVVPPAQVRHDPFEALAERIVNPKSPLRVTAAWQFEVGFVVFLVFVGVAR